MNMNLGRASLLLAFVLVLFSLTGCQEDHERVFDVSQSSVKVPNKQQSSFGDEGIESYVEDFTRNAIEYVLTGL